ncbi:calcium-binding protein [Nostoc commune]|uniref:calcium-binding protein n=1 Tax=Nostoc commune TaxID=1178 RepID=UPI0018C805B0|nr:hypothetical protein [Nostoc commune]MBG1258427.1 hypothetical protein [Nostoc commune BAE]
MATITGNSENNLLSGSTYISNTIYGKDGNDQLYGGKYADYLFGEGGDDILRGDDGNDYLYGGDGNDMIGPVGSDSGLINERDFMSGGSGADSFTLSDDDDGVYFRSGGNSDYAIIYDFSLQEGDSLVLGMSSSYQVGTTSLLGGQNALFYSNDLIAIFPNTTNLDLQIAVAIATS